jgi:hypothetical protein
MPIIPCPQCNRKMSSNASFCSRCGYTEGEVSEETRNVIQSRRLRDRVYHLSMVSYAVISVFVGGFGWFLWATNGFENKPSSGPFILMGISALGYMVVRVLLLRTRQKQKALRKQSSRWS